jgi:hypothetical protein
MPLRKHVSLWRDVKVDTQGGVLGADVVDLRFELGVKSSAPVDSDVIVIDSHQATVNPLANHFLIPVELTICE